MLKKVSKICLSLLVALLLMGFIANAQEPIRVLLDGRQLHFDVHPVIIDNRTMVPMRVIFEELGAEIQWNGATRTITATRDDLVVRTTIGERGIMVNGNRIMMDVAPVIIDGRTLVPVRFVAEAFGTDVDWDGNTQTVFISSPIQFEEYFEEDQYDWREQGEGH